MRKNYKSTTHKINDLIGKQIQKHPHLKKKYDKLIDRLSKEMMDEIDKEIKGEFK